MGSYRQSPVCHHCWETGHTKNHCPEIKQAAANGEQWAKNLIEKQKQSIKNRKCSYCSGRGHNKRGCKRRKSDKAIYDRVNKEFVEERLNDMKENGVAVGSLISYVPFYRSKTGTTTITYVTKIVTENRSPTYRWLEKYFNEKPDGSDGYYRYEKNENIVGQDVVFFLKSVTGTGLGYWGDSETCSVDYEDFEKELRKGTPANMKVVG